MEADDPLLHLSRAAGLGAYLVLWIDMCLGVALTGWLTLPFLPRWRVGDLHEFTGMVGLGLLATHIAVLIGLQQLPFTLAEIIIPLQRQMNPIAPFLGISALYFIVLVTAISHARRYVGLRLWRLVHMLSFAGFALSIAHAITAGPDASSDWLRGMYFVTVAVLAWLTASRIRAEISRLRPRATTGVPFVRRAH